MTAREADVPAMIPEDGPARMERPSEFTEERRIRDAYARREAFAAERECYSRWGNLFILQDRERHVLTLLSRRGLAPLEGKRILEVGCGTGYWIRELVKWGARPEDIAGMDLLEGRIAVARTLCPGGVQLQQGNAEKLPFPDERFDLVIQSTVFTSILDMDLRRSIAGEMLRVLKPGGFILWYDYFIKNPRNPDVKAIRRREIQALFPACRIRLQRITLAPPLARLLAQVSWLLCDLLGKVPLLCTHYLGAIQKRGSGTPESLTHVCNSMPR